MGVDAGEVVGEVLPVVTAAVRAYGREVLSLGEDAAAEATVSLGRRIVQRVSRRSPRPEAVEAAVAELAEAPDDADAQAALRLQIRKVLAADPQVLAEVVSLLPERSGPRAVASGERSVAVGGDNSGPVITGDGWTPSAL